MDKKTKKIVCIVVGMIASIICSVVAGVLGVSADSLKDVVDINVGFVEEVLQE